MFLARRTGHVKSQIGLGRIFSPWPVTPDRAHKAHRSVLKREHVLDHAANFRFLRVGIQVEEYAARMAMDVAAGPELRARDGFDRTVPVRLGLLFTA